MPCCRGWKNWRLNEGLLLRDAVLPGTVDADCGHVSFATRLRMNPLKAIWKGLRFLVRHRDEVEAGVETVADILKKRAEDERRKRERGGKQTT